VYFDNELNDFVEVPKADILYSLPVDKSENPLGGSRIWVKKATVVTMGDPSAANRAKSSFLEGDLISAYGNLGIAGQAGIPLEVTTGTIGTIGGGVTFTINASNLPTCPSVGNGACITNNAPCPSVFACPSRIVVCNFTRLATPCLRTIVNPTCLQTCNKPSCFRTCFQFTCVRQICDVVACRFASLQTGPITTTVINPGNTTIVQTETVVNPGVDFNQVLAAQQQMYSGAFNPFATGNFGM
jgi:hypothetical protein